MPQTIDNMLATWSNSLTTYTALKFNVIDTASSASSLLMDLQVGGSSRFGVRKDGSAYTSSSGTFAHFVVNSNGGGFACNNSGLNDNAYEAILTGYRLCLANSVTIDWASTGTVAGTTPTGDLILGRRAAANLRLGSADAAAPVAQTLSVQSGTAGASATTVSISGTALTIAGTVTGTIAIGHAVTGTGVSAGTVITAGSGTSWTVNNSQTVGPITAYFNSVGQNLTITGSQGSGPSAGGSIVFQVAPAGSAGTTAQNALATALTIDSSRELQAAAGLRVASYAYFQTNRVAINQNGIGDITASSTGDFSFGSSGVSSPDVFLRRDNTGILALRNGANAQTFRVYNTTDGTNSEFGKIAWSSNVLQIGTEKAGTGTARALEFQTDGTTRLTIAATGAVTLAGGINLGGSINLNGSTEATRRLVFNGVGFIKWPSNGIMLLQNDAQTDFGRLQFGGTTSSFPALKRSSTTLQARLADDSAFASVQGKITTDTAYTAGDPTTTGYLVVYDSTGTAYKIPAVAV